MFFWMTERNRRELSMRHGGLRGERGEELLVVLGELALARLLLSTWMTPMVRPRWFFIGAARMERVR